MLEEEKEELTTNVDFSPEKKKHRIGKYIFRVFFSLFTVIAILVYAVFSLCYTIATGPSETVRDLAVLSALQASATKWVPGLFLDDETVKAISDKSYEVVEDVVSLSEYDKKTEEQNKKL